MRRASRETLWEAHGGQWREPEQVIGAWWDGGQPDPALLEHRVRGGWWDLLEGLGIMLIATREYEHLVVSMRGGTGERFSFLPLPHPSGLAVDRASGRVMVASTRNPNQVVELRTAGQSGERLLVPTRTWFYPGSLYMHDLAFIGKTLHANAVGHNAIVRLDGDGSYKRTWWPKAIDRTRGHHFDKNYLQLNSIAAGASVASSFYSASVETRGRTRPGDSDFEVDKRGVIFSGKTREPVCRGLTRPHSARLHDGKIWVDNSGYGELGFVEKGRLEVAVRLPGWTRGLCFHGNIAFVGTSRVLPRFHHYAPGLDPKACICAIHAVDVSRGKVIASIEFPSGNQLFGIDWLPVKSATGLPFTKRNAASRDQHRAFFYACDPGLLQE